jgi:hypothetical protein
MLKLRKRHGKRGQELASSAARMGARAAAARHGAARRGPARGGERRRGC